MDYILLAYASRKLNTAEQTYPTHDREILAIIYASREWLLTQSAYEIDEAAVNVKSCLKVDSGLLYITEGLKLEEVRSYNTTGGARAVARKWLRVKSCVYAPFRLCSAMGCLAVPGDGVPLLS
jgi:RNase H-like domain found in reverse transcriptase